MMDRESSPVYVIAEIGVNHNGDIDLAKQMVRQAAQIGCNGVKFQTFITENLVSKHAEKAPYQKKVGKSEESQFEMLKKLELSWESHQILQEECRVAGVEFLSTPFDRESLDFLLHTLGLGRIKVSSGDLTNAPLLWELGKSKAHVILSTGMATIDDVKRSLDLFSFACMPGSKPQDFSYNGGASSYAYLSPRLSVLHCTSSYPTPLEQVNLSAISTLQQAIGLPIGLSDHTAGTTAAMGAVALGAKVIEKHFTLDKTMPGPDHTASADVGEMTALVAGVRQMEQALGNPEKAIASCERPNMVAARKSLVAQVPIREGELFSEDNLSVKRPGDGLSPFEYWGLLGTKAAKSFGKDELIK